MSALEDLPANRAGAPAVDEQLLKRETAAGVLADVARALKVRPPYDAAYETLTTGDVLRTLRDVGAKWGAR